MATGAAINASAAIKINFFTVFILRSQSPRERLSRPHHGIARHAGLIDGSGLLLDLAHAGVPVPGSAARLFLTHSSTANHRKRCWLLQSGDTPEKQDELAKFGPNSDVSTLPCLCPELYVKCQLRLFGWGALEYFRSLVSQQ